MGLAAGRDGREVCGGQGGAFELTPYGCFTRPASPGYRAKDNSGIGSGL